MTILFPNPAASLSFSLSVRGIPLRFSAVGTRSVRRTVFLALSCRQRSVCGMWDKPGTDGQG